MGEGKAGKQWDGWGGATMQFGGCELLGSGVWTWCRGQGCACVEVGV